MKTFHKAQQIIKNDGNKSKLSQEQVDSLQQKMNVLFLISCFIFKFGGWSKLNVITTNLQTGLYKIKVA